MNVPKWSSFSFLGNEYENHYNLQHLRSIVYFQMKAMVMEVVAAEGELMVSFRPYSITIRKSRSLN